VLFERIQAWPNPGLLVGKCYELRENTMHKTMLRLIAALAACAALSASAATAHPPLSADTLRQMTPAAAEAAVRAQVRAQRAERRQARTAGAADITPPVVIRFDAPATADVQGLGTLVPVNVHFSDDLSGVISLMALAEGPGNSFFLAESHLTYPLLRGKAVLTADTTSAFSLPGIYTFKWAYAFDEAGNSVYLDHDALAALGNASVTVRNKAGYDITAPQLVGGTILTPEVSLGGTHPGTDAAPFVGIELRTTDSGDSAVAGVRSAELLFCVADRSRCLSLSAQMLAPGRSHSKLTLGRQVRSGQFLPGTFLLHSLRLDDHANNVSFYQSLDFGGTTDFGAFFQSTTLTLKP
jgi:hypothetical protein